MNHKGYCCFNGCLESAYWKWQNRWLCSVHYWIFFNKQVAGENNVYY